MTDNSHPKPLKLSEAALDNLITMRIGQPTLVKVTDTVWVQFNDISSITEDSEGNTRITLRRGSTLSYIQVDEPIREVLSALATAVVILEGAEEGVLE